MWLDVATSGLPEEFAPYELVIWSGADHIPTHVDASESGSCVELESTSETVHVHCVGWTLTGTMTRVKTWFGVASFAPSVRQTRVKVTPIAQSGQRMERSNGTLVVSLHNQRGSVLPRRVYSSGGDSVGWTSDSVSEQSHSKTLKWKASMYPIDPLKPHGFSTGSEFFDIFFSRLNCFRIPVCHVLLSPRVHREPLMLVENAFDIVESREGIKFMDLKDPAKEGEFLAHSLMRMVNYATYCEDFNLCRDGMRTVCEKVCPNIGVVGSGDCEDYAFFLYFVYETILMHPSKESSPRMRRAREVARRYVPVVQLGAVGSARMMSAYASSQRSIGGKTASGDFSEFEAHSYFQMLPVQFVLRNMEEAITLAPSYGFDTNGVFDPPLQHQVLEGTNLSVTQTTRSSGVIKSRPGIAGVIKDRAVTSRVKSLNTDPSGFYNYVLMGVTGAFIGRSSMSRVFQISYRTSEMMYGVSFSDSITLRDGVYEIMACAFHTDAEVQNSRRVLHGSMPIIIDGEVSRPPERILLLWRDTMARNGVSTNRRKSELKQCSREVMLTRHDCNDLALAESIASGLRSYGVEDVYLRFEAVNDHLWGITLGF